MYNTYTLYKHAHLYTIITHVCDVQEKRSNFKEHYVWKKGISQ